MDKEEVVRARTELTDNEKAKSYENFLHIREVQNTMLVLLMELQQRMVEHDSSKVEMPEAEGFAEFVPKLKGLTYGSDEYKATLEQMKPFLDHHYENNMHHPEYWDGGIAGMTLVDLVEMFCDWKAATKRHADGNILKSLEINKERFNIPDELVQITKNTLDFFED